MIWAVGNGIFALLMFVLGYRFFGKTVGISPKQWGVKISGKNLARTILLAALVVLAGYNVTALACMFFNTDFRPWTFAMKLPTVSAVFTMLRYAPFFFIYYFASSLSINGVSRVKGQKEWLNMLFS